MGFHDMTYDKWLSVAWSAMFNLVKSLFKDDGHDILVLQKVIIMLDFV